MAAKKTTTEENSESQKEQKPFYGPDVYKRNEHGLLKNLNYIFNEDGSVNWRAMIKPEFLYVRKDWFEARGQEVPSSPDGLQDNQLAIMLGGIKELAKIRGFSSVDFQIVSKDTNYVIATCRIEWIGNYETSGQAVLFEDCANATTENTNGFGHKFLETIACNRAFVRCVRNFLNIHIVGVDELDKSTNATREDQPSQQDLTPANQLEKLIKEKLDVDFEGFKNTLREFWKEDVYRNEDAGNWQSFNDIPIKEARKLYSIIKKRD